MTWLRNFLAFLWDAITSLADLPDPLEPIEGEDGFVP
jgi:hypothetical protein